MPTLLLNRQCRIIDTESAAATVKPSPGPTSPRLVRPSPRRTLGLPRLWGSRLPPGYPRRPRRPPGHHLRRPPPRPLRGPLDPAVAQGPFGLLRDYRVRRDRALGGQGDEGLMIARLNGMTLGELVDAREASRTWGDGLPPLEGSLKQVAWADSCCGAAGSTPSSRRGPSTRSIGSAPYTTPPGSSRITTARSPPPGAAQRRRIHDAEPETRRDGSRTGVPDSPTSTGRRAKRERTRSAFGDIFRPASGRGSTLEIDPLATLFPPMDGGGVRGRLKADIAARMASSRPIWTQRGRVVDGRHRLQAPAWRAGPRPDGPRLRRRRPGPGLRARQEPADWRHPSGNPARALVAARLMPTVSGAPARAKTSRGENEFGSNCQPPTAGTALLRRRLARDSCRGARQSARPRRWPGWVAAAGAATRSRSRPPPRSPRWMTPSWPSWCGRPWKACRPCRRRAVHQHP